MKQKIQMSGLSLFFLMALCLVVGLLVDTCRQKHQAPVDVDSVKREWKTNTITNPVPKEIRP